MWLRNPNNKIPTKAFWLLQFPNVHTEDEKFLNRVTKVIFKRKLDKVLRQLGTVVLFKTFLFNHLLLTLSYDILQSRFRKSWDAVKLNQNKKRLNVSQGLKYFFFFVSFFFISFFFVLSYFLSIIMKVHFVIKHIFGGGLYFRSVSILSRQYLRGSEWDSTADSWWQTLLIIRSIIYGPLNIMYPL